MRIKKAKLKQIIQEELQKLSEQGPIARMKARKARGDRQEIDPETGKIVYQTTDMARPAQDMTSDYGAPGQSEFDRDTEYDKQMDADVDSQVASGGIEFGDSIRPGGDTDPTVTSSTMVDDILSGKPEGAEGAFGDAGDAAAAPVRRVASGQMRKNINKAWKAGLFGPYEGGKKGTASRKVWRDARRALYKSTDSAAAILAAAGVDANTGGALAVAAAPSADPTVGIQPSPGPASGGAAPDVAGAPAPAVAKSASRQLGPGLGDLERDMLKLKKGLVTSELSQSGQERYQTLRNTFLDQGEEPREASLKARKSLKSQIENRVKKRSAQRRLAKQYFERFKNQGLDDSEAVQLANSALKGRGEPLNTPPALQGDTGVTRALTNVRGGGRPGQFEESLDRLTKIVEEEFDKVLAEKDKGEEKKKKTALQRAQERYDKHKAAHDKEKTNKSRTKMLAAKRALEALKRAAGGKGNPGGN